MNNRTIVIALGAAVLLGGSAYAADNTAKVKATSQVSQSTDFSSRDRGHYQGGGGWRHSYARSYRGGHGYASQPYYGQQYYGGHGPGITLGFGGGGGHYGGGYSGYGGHYGGGYGGYGGHY